MPGIFARIVDAATPADMYGANLDGHLEVEGNLFEVAVPAVGVILAALAGELPVFARSSLLLTLVGLVGGDSHHSEMAAGRTHLGDECRYRAREGLWLVLREGHGERAELVEDIIAQVDNDSARLSYYTEVLRRRKKRS